MIGPYLILAGALLFVGSGAVAGAEGAFRDDFAAEEWCEKQPKSRILKFGNNMIFAFLLAGTCGIMVVEGVG
jgi:hypothetical protein